MTALVRTFASMMLLSTEVIGVIKDKDVQLSHPRQCPIVRDEAGCAVLHTCCNLNGIRRKKAVASADFCSLTGNTRAYLSEGQVGEPLERSEVLLFQVPSAQGNRRYGDLHHGND